MVIALKNALTVKEIAEICGGSFRGDGDMAIGSLATDSRESTGSLFCAISGESIDGHRFCESACASGALAVMVDLQNETAKEWYDKDKNVTVIFVKNTSYAIGSLAKYFFDKLGVSTVGVTGSVGKTTTKELCAAVLSARYSVLKTKGNQNNELGLPYTMFDCKDEKIAVLEMGMNHKGEISYLSKLANPYCALITNIGTSHIENLGSREGIAEAKLEITDGMKDGGYLIINGNEPLLSERVLRYKNLHVIDVSDKNENAEVYVYNISEDASAMETCFDVRVGNMIIDDCRVFALGRHIALDSAFAVALGVIFGLMPEEIKAGLESFSNTGMRQKITECDGCYIIEDCYNASYEAMAASLCVLSKIAKQKGGRAIAVLGEMRELGEYSQKLHENVGAAASKNADLLFAFGDMAKYIASGAESGGMDKDKIVFEPDLENGEKLADMINKIKKPNDVILFKASRAVKLERVMNIVKGGCIND
ncbi:MAG: UDP-N-acetylmuramoyl-tripeptide--D-alanyl-D-alanine ligase [Clostridia bacterium]|nr:UDP-N-acetylmuramoyl-tripeptide--D-alanyl-D-alanine ligase [Clostridia bacterium]